MSEGIQIEALRHNQIDCMVNYTGNIWTLVMKRKDFLDRQATIDEVDPLPGRRRTASSASARSASRTPTPSP